MLDDLLEQYGHHLVVLRGLTKRSVGDYQRRVSLFFDWLNQDGRTTAIESVTREDVEAWLKHLYYDRRNGTYTRHTKLGALSGFWRFLVYEKLATEDITAQIPRPRIKPKMIQYFTRGEVIKFFEASPPTTEKGLRDTCILIVMAFAGLRVGELCGLRLADLVDDGHYVDILVNEEIGKQGHSRAVDLWAAPAVFIRRWLNVRITQGAKIDDPLFVSYRKNDQLVGRRLSGNDIDRLVKELATAAGVRKPRIHSHMFRATHGSDLLFVRGFTIAAIAARLGHKNIATTDRYLPRRGRVNQEYRSLRDYWRTWEQLYTQGGATSVEGREQGTD
ncbi:MAG: tyrosine-type recombinase/integrase [Desulfobulbaceae bacterium]|nr:tyrosine-type recombinase/integrase [Desulfobulbaceae bacterium]